MGSPRRWRGSAVACPRPRRGRTRAAPGRSRLPLPPPCRASAHTGGRGPAFPPRRPLGRSRAVVLRRPRLRRVGALACSAPGLSRCLVLLPLALPPAALSPSPSRPPPPPGAGERKRLTPAAAGTGGARLSQRTKKASPPVALTTCEKAQKAYFVQLSIYPQNLLPFDNAHSESTDGSAVGGMIPICSAPPDSAIPHSELIKPAASGQASPKSFEIGMIRDELDSLHQPLRVSAGRRLHAGQRRRGGPPRPGRRLRPLYPDGRRAARIASPIFRTGIRRSPGGAVSSPFRRDGMRHWVKPSRRTSLIR